MSEIFFNPEKVCICPVEDLECPFIGCYNFVYDSYRGIGLENLYVRDAPLMVIHRVSGSLPNCSFVAPVVEDTAVGTVIGMVVEHLLPPAV